MAITLAQLQLPRVCKNLCHLFLW